ncbi:MAG: histidine phosphotransferase family protein [Proteobacteria bacterium]|nr:histidine phosphotransferase family protein [Pseudomonadota bacterium]MDA0952871.1 histidine phosphotransferase family protein [Pseudomonadota bacterium]
MSEADGLRLTALVCSRLCHDLVGPAGAIANGLELMAEPAMAGEALKLTQTTSAQLNRRLAFYRRAYGTGDRLTWAEAGELARDMLEGGRHTLDWRGEPGSGGAEAVRLALNMLLCVMDATPMGARLSVTAEDLPRVTAEGQVRHIDALRAALADPTAPVGELSPRDAQPVLTLRLARASGWTLALESQDDEHLTLALIASCKT